MQRNLMTALALAGALVLVRDRSTNAQELDANSVLGTPITYKNLTLIPVLSKTKVEGDRDYLALDEAFDKKLVGIAEKPDEQVNELTLENRSDRPMFVMAGEVILGGKQDRIIGKDSIIPSKQKLAIPVFCVEHGRWTEEKGSREFRSGKVMAHTTLRTKAKHEAQQQVWDEVSVKNQKHNISNDTGTYRNVAEGNGGDVAASVKGYATHFDKELGKLPADRALGFVVVMNGEVAGVETFASPRLFAKLQGKLARSYYLEAVDLPPPADPAALRRVVADKDVKVFLEKGAKAKRQAVIDRKEGKTVQFDEAGVAGSEVTAPNPAKPAAAPDQVYKSTYMH